MTMERSKKKQKLRNAEYFDLQDTFDRLYAQSQTGKQFPRLIEIVTSRENILLAYRNMSKNKGSKTAGTDGKTIRYLAGFTDNALVSYVRKRLEWYQPQPVRRVEIPKGDTGKTRPLSIPTISDRLIQQCFLQVLEPICEAKFHERSNGFRPNRSTEHALAQCYAMIQKRNLHFVIDIDIKGFFDNVSHGKLLKQMWSIGIRDKCVLSIISAMLKAEIAGIGFPERGTAQGSLISPLLSNIVLNELDWWITSQWENMPTRNKREYARSDNGVIDKNQKYEMLRKGSNLKECYILHYLMRNPIQYASVELNNNRLALYCAQHGCCAITKRQLEIGSIHCHHKEPKRQGGDDRYSNLVLISEDVHVLVHATDNDVITKYMHSLKLNAKQKAKLNTLRKKAGLFLI